MATLPSNKYQLKSLHEEIGLFDRKIAYLLKYESFPNEGARTAAADKMAAKRELLVRNARKMVAEGVSFAPADLPRSLREPGSEAPAAAEAEPLAAPESTETIPPAPQPPVREASPYAGTALDPAKHLQGYKRTNKRA